MLGILALVACENSKIELGGGPEPDARLIADLYTWECNIQEDEEIVSWEGAFSYNVSMQYAPDALPSLDLPASGCNAGADIFPGDAGTGAQDLPDGTPDWYNTDDFNGTFDQDGTGFYFEDVFSNQRTCTRVEEILGDGTKLANAGSFSGARTPTPGELASISITGADIDATTGLPFGSELDVAWESTDWDATWVQIRREQGGSLVEAATCNTTGDTTFSVDSDVWDLLHDTVVVDVTNLYVGTQSTSTITTDDGQEIELITRMMHIAVVQD